MTDRLHHLGGGGLRLGLPGLEHLFGGRFLAFLPDEEQGREQGREPGGVRIVADGACSMGRWAVKDSREIDIRYHAFSGKYLPKDEDTVLATCR